MLNIDPGLYLRPPGRVSPRSSHPYVVRPIVSRVDVYKHSLLVKTIEEWNKLSPEMFKGVNSLASFEEKLQSLDV